MMAYYFANTCIPKIMAGAADNDTLGVTAGTVANFGGILGCVLFSALAVRYRANRLLAGFLLAAAQSFCAFGVAFGQIAVAIVLAGVIGLLVNGAVPGFYTVSMGVYTARARATGVGWMIGIGRLISIISPIFVGYLISGGWSPENVFYLFALPLLAAAAAVIALSVSLRGTKAASEPDNVKSGA